MRDCGFPATTFAGSAHVLPPPGGRAHDGRPCKRAALRAHGGVGPLIAALAGLPVVGSTGREPSLLEIFIQPYDVRRPDAGN